jgi:hypothetical protein
MTDDEVAVEHARLLEQTAELQREHDALHDADDPTGTLHAEHRVRLQQKIAELQAHMARLENQRRTDADR